MGDDGKPHRGGGTKQSLPLSDRGHSSDKGDGKDDLRRFCMNRLAPLRCVLSPCVFPEYCVLSTSDSRAIFSAVTAVDTPVSQAEAGG